MREIKFRGLTTDTKEWIYGSLERRENVDLIGAYLITPMTNSDPCGDTIWNEELVIKSSVGQYTGLHDKNGVEIYEGDVVIVTGKAYDVENKPTVVWGKKSHGWSLKCDIDDKFIKVKYYSLPSSKDIEIIGNIHTNPELLNNN